MSTAIATIRQCCRVIGQPRNGRSAEALLDAAVDHLLAAGATTAATTLYLANYATACGWRERGGQADDHSTVHGVGQYTRESALGTTTRAMPAPRPYHGLPSGPRLDGTHLAPAGFIPPTNRQAAARAEFTRLWAGRHTQPATQADLAEARATILATL